MNNITKSQITCPVIAGVIITTDEQGRYNLNALHKASGLGNNKAPAQWLRTQTAQELVHELTDMQKCTSPINTIKGGINQGTFAHELLAVSYAGWISPKYQLMVNQVFLDCRNNLTPIQKESDVSGIPELRKAQALDTAYNVSEKICLQLPNLSPQSKQVIIAGLINPIFGQIIPLPILEDKTYSATDIGNLLGITSKAVGTIANDHNLKTEQYGMFVLDKSRSSNKQVSVFRYNERGLNAIKNIFGGNHE